MSERKDPLDEFLKLRVSSPISSPALPAASLLKGDLQARLLAFQKGRAARTPASNESLPAEENKQISLPPLPLLPLLPLSYLMPLAMNDTLSRLSSVKSNSGRPESKSTSFLTPTSEHPLELGGNPSTSNISTTNSSSSSASSSSASSSSKPNSPADPLQPTKFHPKTNSTGSIPMGPLLGVLRSSSLLKQAHSDSKVPQVLPQHTSPQVMGRLELSKKPSLSQRRGMKLDVTGLNNSSNSTPLNPVDGLASTSALKLNKAESPLKESTPQGLFSNYSKYVDIKEGKLNFAGKASLHAQGVDFLSGSSFRISKDQLEFVEELGRGNYGTVSKVIHKPTGVLMAMKEVRLELEESKFTQILMELDILHKCVSPYIVDFYGAFFVEGGVFMCMEYMDGGLLDKIFGGVGVELETALAYITECVIRGLKELKDEHNIIHRDVKPTNILLNTAGRVKLCDFGVSGNLVALMARTNIGCQLYMAPERIWLKQPVDSASSYTVQLDVWLLGLTMLEISLGHYPYPPETYDNMFLQLTAIVDGEPPKLDARFLKSAQLFVKQCLTKNPDLRPHYGTLLQNPWLLEYRDRDPHMSEIVTSRLKAIQEKTPLRTNLVSESKAAARQTPANVPNVRLLLKEKVRAPALHRGGLPMQGRFRK